MPDLFGVSVSREELDALVPSLWPLVGVRYFREDNGPGAGQRILRIDNGGGLSIELLPDRTCDLGQVWCGAIPFGWMGPIGIATPAALGRNSSLAGLMTTCGFDHIRQPDSDGGVDYPLHGSMMHRPATILAAGLVEDEGTTLVRVVAEATQFSLATGGMRLHRTISVPVGGRHIDVEDVVSVLSLPQPIMAMYHINLGFPLAGPDSRLTLGGEDVTDPCISGDGIRTRPSGGGLVRSELSGSPNGPSFVVEFDGDQLPVFQTLRNARAGTNLICIEPASHERRLRADLRRAGALSSATPGASRRFRLRLSFHPGASGAPQRSDARSAVAGPVGLAQPR